MMTKLRWILVVSIILVAVLAAGYRLTRPEPETAAAAPVPPVAQKTEALSLQVTTVEEVAARGLVVAAEPLAVFTAEESGFHISYPGNWDRLTLSTTTTLLQSPDGASRVQVEDAGPLPADGLAAFVDRSLGSDIIYSRQLLTVHGLPAERVVTYSDTAGSSVTTFYIQLNGSVIVVTGSGEQQAIEMIARSLNAPQLVALR